MAENERNTASITLFSNFDRFKKRSILNGFLENKKSTKQKYKLHQKEE
jgi:hypothetical protein